MDFKERAQAAVAKLSLEEKVALGSGESFWETKAMKAAGIPALFTCDGPHGLRKQDREGGQDMLGVNESRPATCFPAEVTTAGSWDPDLTEQIGRAVGREARAQGVGLVLGPGANIKRNPLCGRNFEYFSEDPLLAGGMAAGFIRGVESQGVATSLKHFCANSQETCRMNSNSEMDERTLREIYLPAFEKAVREGRPSTVMCSYPKLNGVHCSDNKFLLTDVLRDEWGFEGLVVTDWGGMSDRIEGYRAGCDLSMPGGSDYMEADVVDAVRAGTLDEALVDAAAVRVAELALREAEALGGPTEANYAAHADLAREAAERGAVLLQNDGTLPLCAGQTVALVGHMAKEMRYQGAGSSHINAWKVIQPAEAIEHVAFAEGCDARGDTNDALLAQAADAARAADVAVVFAGLPDRYESEGFDRDDMAMPAGHVRMIEAVAKANPRTVVVLTCGCAVECPWAEKVAAILYMGLPGESGGAAVANLLSGRAVPAGRLAESWPVAYADVPSAGYYAKSRDAEYREGIYVGYRYFDRAGVPVRWAFGHGLSYTSFSYANLEAARDHVEVDVTNEGQLAGDEVVQVYVAVPGGAGGIHRPARALAGWLRVHLEVGEKARVRVPVDLRAFSVWDGGWKVVGGTYQAQVGGGSDDIRLRAAIEVDGACVPAPAWQAGSWYEKPCGEPPREGWEALLGHPYVPEVPTKGRFTMDNTVVEMKDSSLVMRVMYRSVEKVIAKGFDGKVDYENPEFRMLMASSAGSPMRSMQISGGMKGGVMAGLVEMANGHFVQGIGKMIRGK